MENNSLLASYEALLKNLCSAQLWVVIWRSIVA